MTKVTKMINLNTMKVTKCKIIEVVRIGCKTFSIERVIRQVQEEHYDVVAIDGNIGVACLSNCTIPCDTLHIQSRACQFFKRESKEV
jgi:hypothetical protein